MNDNSNSTDDLPKRIKSIRQQLGLSQEELAQKLGVSFTSVNRWENGQTKPSKLARRQIHRADIRKDLLAYCKHDTLLMVYLHKWFFASTVKIR